MPSDARHSTIRVVLLVTISGLLILSASCRGDSPNPALAAAAEAQRSEGVSCLGRIVPGDRVLKVAAPAQSIVKRLLVQRGSVVRAGQEVAVLRDYDAAAAAVAEAAGEVRFAESALAQAKAGEKPATVAAQQAAVERQDSVRRNADTELARKRDLARDGLLPGAELEAAQLAVETARHALTREREILESLSQVRVQDVEVAQKRLELARTREQRARVELDRNRIHAPASGTVLEIHAYPGEVVSTEGILDLGDVQNMYVLAEVYMSDVSRVRQGAQAAITGEGFDGTLEGTVEEILREASNNQLYPTDGLTAADKRVLGVRIRLRDAARVRHLSNSQVSVRIQP